MERSRNNQNGFTLVELAIVIVIIGLLVGGVLQGQELIRQAQIRNDIKRLTEFKSATTMFYGKYNVLPGDMTSANAINFFGYSNGGGNQNGRIDWSDESARFWGHLTFAKLLNSLFNASGGVPFSAGSYGIYAKFDVGKGSTSSGATSVVLATYGDIYGSVAIGNNILLVSTTNNYNQVNLAAVTATGTRIIDEKIDDGKPSTGIIIGYGGQDILNPAITGNCSTSGVYTNDDSVLACKVFYDLGL